VKELPLACSLEGADLAERGERWRELARLALTGRDRRGGGGRLEFAASAEVEAELRELVRLEGECCAFLDLGVESADGRLALTITGPPGAEPIVESFLALPARG
jgi:hypothetical protein